MNGPHMPSWQACMDRRSVTPSVLPVALPRTRDPKDADLCLLNPYAAMPFATPMLPTEIALRGRTRKEGISRAVRSPTRARVSTLHQDVGIGNLGIRRCRYDEFPTI